MAKFKFPKSELDEFWEVERFDCCLGGYRYKSRRVFVVCAASKEECREAMKQFIERSCA